MKTKTMTMTDARLKFGNLGLQARRSPIEVTRDGVVEFVVISPERYRQLLGSPSDGKEAQRSGISSDRSSPQEREPGPVQKDIPAFLKRVRAAKAAAGGGKS